MFQRPKAIVIGPAWNGALSHSKGSKSMRRLKIVFYVEEAADGSNFDPATNKVVVEKQQINFDVADDGDDGDAANLRLSDLARDHNHERIAAIEAAKAGGATEITDELKAKLREIDASLNFISPWLIANGEAIGRFIRIKLREWAQKQRQHEPA